MKCKKLISAVCAVVMAAGMAGVPAVANISGTQTLMVVSAAQIDKTIGDYDVTVIDNNRVRINKYNGKDSVVIVPAELDGMPVVNVWGDVFSYNDKITKVVIPEGVKKFGMQVFYGCSNLEEVVLPESITEWYIAQTFNRCPNLKKINIPSTLTDISGFFMGTGVENVTLPNTVKVIGGSAFYNCRSLKTVTIPNSVTEIGDDAFRGSSIKTLTIPNSVNKIGDAAFYESDITELNIPGSVKSLGEQAFRGCKSLTSITLNEGLEIIDEGCFWGTTALKEIRIPKSVKELKQTYYAPMGYVNARTQEEKIEGFKIIGYCGSVAETYATKRGFEFERIHSYTSTITKAATCTENGTLTYTCSCGDSYTESIPATGHEYNEEVIAPTTTAEGYTLHTCSKCNYSYKDNITEKLPAPVATKTSISKATAKFSATAVSYTGKSKMPKLTVTYGGKTLVKGKDYTVSGKNCKNPGKATITITGIGNYTGTKTMNFYIVPKKPTMTKATSTTKKKISLAWKRDSLADGYQIIVYSDKTCKTKVKSAMAKKNTTVKGTLSGLTSGKTYYVRMRAYKTIDGKKKAGAFCAVKTVKVK